VVTNCNQLKFLASDGKIRLTDCANVETLFRIIQSIPSKNAKPMKRWHGRKYTGTQHPVFLEAKNLKPFINNDLSMVLTSTFFKPKEGVNNDEAAKAGWSDSRQYTEEY